METPVVSVFCTAYNHEKYIARALESVICQKTNFPFELIVHDDASTDGTAAVIREYAARYPQIIRPIYQTENQYSKGIEVFDAFIKPLCRGKYIAICEGDDFWCCEDKLQLQVNAMEANPQAMMCAHAYKRVEADGEKLIREDHALDHNGWLQPEKVIQGKQAPHTSTFLYRREMHDHYPEFFNKLDVTDYPIRVYCAISGGIYYLDRIMSCYRKFVTGSWTDTMHKDSQAYREHIEKSRAFQVNLQEFTGAKYYDAIQRQIDYCDFRLTARFGKLADAVKMPYFRGLTPVMKVVRLVSIRWPNAWVKILWLRTQLLGKHTK